jgi:hypothetical protein
MHYSSNGKAMEIRGKQEEAAIRHIAHLDIVFAGFRVH